MPNTPCRFSLPPAVVAELARGSVSPGASPSFVSSMARRQLRRFIRAMTDGAELPTIPPGDAPAYDAPGFWLPLPPEFIARVGGGDCDRARDALRAALARSLGIEWPRAGRPQSELTRLGLSRVQQLYAGRLLVAGVPRAEAIRRAREYQPRRYSRRKSTPKN